MLYSNIVQVNFSSQIINQSNVASMQVLPCPIVFLFLFSEIGSLPPLPSFHSQTTLAQHSPAWPLSPPLGPTKLNQMDYMAKILRRVLILFRDNKVIVLGCSIVFWV